MSGHPNLTVVRAGYRAFAEQDVAGLEAFLRPDAVWHSAGRNWLVGDYYGRTAILTLFGVIAAYAEGSYQIEITDMLANDERVVVLSRISAQRADGRSLSVDTVGVFELSEGRVREAWSWPYDGYAEDAYYGLEPPPGLAPPPRVSGDAGRAAP